VFGSGRHIAGTNDTSVVGQIFEYDADTGVIVRVSVGQSTPAGDECETTHVVEERYGCDGNVTSGGFSLALSLIKEENTSFALADPTSGLAVSKEGVVEFESPNVLTPLAVPGEENVYEYRAGDVYLISPGTEAIPPIEEEGASRAQGIDESGEDVFFVSTEGLVPQDTDTQTSFYDARVEGGFPGRASQPACVGETCQGPIGAAPPLPATSGSAVAVAGGNLAPPLVPAPVVKSRVAAKCKKGYVKKKGKCVKKPKVKAKRADTGRASNDRGGES
jgi:hypothetical protein